MLENTMPETELVYALAKGTDIIWQSQSFVLDNSMCLLLIKLSTQQESNERTRKVFKSQQEGAFEKINVVVWQQLLR